MKRFISILYFVWLGLLAMPQLASAQNQIYIKLGDAQVKRSLLALPAIQYLGSPHVPNNHVSTGTEIYRTISNDLSVSGLFQFLDDKSYLEDLNTKSILPISEDPNGYRWEPLRKIGAEFIIRTAFSIAGDQLTLDANLYQVSTGAKVFSQRYKGGKNISRRIAHTFCNDVMLALTGKKGMFLSRIVFASNRGSGQAREIWVSDWDTASPLKITNHKSIALSPAWSADGNRIAYTAFVQRIKTSIRNADLFMYDLTSGKRSLVSYRSGMNSGAAFMPDNSGLLLTISKNQNPDIYRLSNTGDIIKKITDGPRGALNVEPAVSPDGQSVAFSSDRSGVTMIYVMGIDGSSPRRITFAGKFNSTPAWSPDGKKLAFSGWNDSNFDIFTVNVDGSDMKKITSAMKPNGKQARNEDPVFSPDGRHLMYTSDRSGHFQIYISNLDGSDERRLTNDQFDYYKPKWSKNIE
jgi:TolB protein